MIPRQSIVHIAAAAALATFFLIPTARGDSPSTGPTTTQPSPAIVTMEFIFDKAPFPSCHASTIAETDRGLVAAWFGGTRERNPDVGIWVSQHTPSGWTPPVEVANGIQPDGSPRLPTWNPVLFQPKSGPLQLYYKVGPAPAKWWGMMMTSADGGATWSPPRRLPDGILGPIKDKPIQLDDGTILAGSSTENNGWQLHIERSTDNGATWTKSEPLNDGKTLRLIQPTLLDLGHGRIEALCRSHHEKIYSLWSADNGLTWSQPAPTDLPNPNSGIDSVRLHNGRCLLVYNHSPKARFPLDVATSNDGKTWSPPQLIEDRPDHDGQLSYPAVIQTNDGLVHLTYTWNRKKIRHVILDPKLLP